MLLRVHKMNDSAIRIEISNNELYQVARPHLRLGGVRELAESLIAVFLVEARPFVVILDKDRVRRRIFLCRVGVNYIGIIAAVRIYGGTAIGAAP